MTVHIIGNESVNHGGNRLLEDEEEEYNNILFKNTIVKYTLFTKATLINLNLI